MEKDIEDQILNLKLHEHIHSSVYIITRVIGGWIYEDRVSRNIIFIPKNGTI